MEIKNLRVRLRSFELDDSLLLNKWRNDNDIHFHTSGNKYFISSEYDKKWIEKRIFDTNNIYLGICLKRDDSLIGYLSINDIDWRNRSAEWGGIIIGEKELWNKGYATEAAYLMLKHVFEELGINCFHAVWLEEHQSSIKMGEKLGFKKEGILRNRIYKAGQFHNQVSMSILHEEFKKINLKIESNG